jgi:hypothetical protein
MFSCLPHIQYLKKNSIKSHTYLALFGFLSGYVFLSSPYISYISKINKSIKAIPIWHNLVSLVNMFSCLPHIYHPPFFPKDPPLLNTFFNYLFSNHFYFISLHIVKITKKKILKYFFNLSFHLIKVTQPALENNIFRFYHFYNKLTKPPHPPLFFWVGQWSLLGGY